MKSAPKSVLAMVLVTAIFLLPTAAIADETIQAATKDQPTKAPAGQVNPALLDPGLANETAPAAFRVKLKTTKGDVTILVNRSWAPNDADRFYNLVKIGYYDEVAFYRVIKGFMAQCGFNGDPAINATWSRARISDDPVVQSNTRGMVTFAQPSAPDARTTQFFINFGDNGYLKKHGAFAPFGKVIDGMDVMESIYSGYGEGAPQGNGPNQAQVSREGNTYLKKSYPKLDYITRATIVEDE